MILRSHDRWRCPKCRYTCLFPPTLSGEPKFWCPMCSMRGEDVAMQIVHKKESVRRRASNSPG